ncbi:hypothetical protein N202_01765 [Helicobacter pylori UM067]|nr:hypothetical protein N202_01765 [Helicobacter pylori UM067]
MRDFSFNTNAFFADTNHQTSSSFSALATHLLQPLKRMHAMLDKITKACYNFIALF